MMLSLSNRYSKAVCNLDNRITEKRHECVTGLKTRKKLKCISTACWPVRLPRFRLAIDVFPALLKFQGAAHVVEVLRYATGEQLL